MQKVLKEVNEEAVSISGESIVGKAKSKGKGPEVENFLFHRRTKKEAGS